MNGFLQWFKSSTKMKRWMFLMLIGIILACYGMSEVLVSKELDLEILTIGKIVGAFVLGFTFIVIGIVFINKRNLELMIEATDERMQNKNNVNVNSLIFNKKIYHKGPNIVVIGGGTGIDTVLEGLKDYTSNITAIVAVSDYGKEPSVSRQAMKLLPLDDIKNSIIALSEKSDNVRNLLNYQFNNGKLKDLSFSDIYFSAMLDINKDFTDSIRNSNEVFNMVGKVIPVTLDEMKICAELANGYIVEEKERIPEVVYDKVTSINRIFLNPSNCRPAPGVLDAIKEADSIIIGPGSLYTNVIPNLLVSGVSKAIKESKAIKIYVSNIMTEPGQTDNYNLSDHINALIDHCGEGIIDYCLYDTGEVVPEFIKKYNMEGAELVEQNIDDVKNKGITYLQRNLSTVTDEYIRHNPILVAASIIEIICDDLKYKDKQNDPQFMMMNTKLKSDKRIEKLKKSSKSTSKREKRIRGKSKFSNKYKDRIASIKEADEKFNKYEKRQPKRVIKIKEKVPEEIISKKLEKSLEENILGKDVNKVNKKKNNRKDNIVKDEIKITRKQSKKSQEKPVQEVQIKNKIEKPIVNKIDIEKKEYINKIDKLRTQYVEEKNIDKSKETEKEENTNQRLDKIQENFETKTVDQIRREMLEKLQKVKWD